jgi:hypothetical protein
LVSGMADACGPPRATDVDLDIGSSEMR